jgi:glucokinase
MEKLYLGIDIGGTAVKLGLVTEAGAVTARSEASVCADGYKTPILTSVLAAAQEFLRRQAMQPSALSGIGVSATGQIDSSRGVVAGTCGNLPGWVGCEIQKTLEEAFGLPVTVANDANCMCLGEAWVGAARGYTDVIGITLGTGVGGGILTGGRLLEGARGLGGELGHYRTHALDGVECTCGARGCWERYAATTALVRAAATAAPELELSDGRKVFAAAAAGDERVRQVLSGWIDEIAEGLAGMVHIFNPQLILIGGGVSGQQELLIEPLAARVRAAVMPAFAEALEVRAAALHNDAGLVGAVYYFRTRHGEA